ncbi:MAG: Na+/H+ antiporter NhaC family protein [Gammaproteobacteria bacterium]|nr:Na+/H+ antiporter NhaC family protein [Gammaproteobacteria bacterium]
MTLIDFATSPLSVLPALLALTLAVVTRKVLLSLGFGVLLGALLLTDFGLVDSASYVFDKVRAVVITEDGINSWNMSIVSFLLLLGIITALITLSGGTRAFANWALTRIKSKRGASLLAAVLGVFIFIDDYFNSLAVGAIARPVTDRHNISRSKLAYILDSTAAPMCILMPLSSWGAYIMTIISGILIGHGVTEYSALGAYAMLIPMNFYAIFTLLMVFAVIWFKLDIGLMKQHEYQAELNGLDNTGKTGADLIDEYGIEESPKGSVYNLILPIVSLIFATLFFMLYSGGQALAEKNIAFSLIGGFENTDVGSSLCYGALVALAMIMLCLIRQKTAASLILHASWVGAKSMFGAIIILFFAWTIGSVISDMHTGAYLSSLVQGNIDLEWLPVILFILAGIMAFATGTSWGTFGIMLPIAGDMAANTDISLMLPMLSAVLAGSVFGDHCSPISDTTILSSTGARCDHIDHVRSQLPYALATAFISVIGFIVLGFTGQLLMALAVTSAVFVLMLTAMKALAAK